MTADTTAVDAVPEETPPETNLFRRLIQGELGELRVIAVLAVIWIIFQSQESRFLSAQNLTNLSLQVTAVGLISVGVVLVLLLGEIDLSVGAVSGLCAAIMAVLNVKHGWSPYTAIAAGVVAGVAIGTFQGAMFTAFGIPSFVVTLAGLLVWQGALLKVLGSTGTLNVLDPKITGLTGTFYDDQTSWGIAVVAIAVYVVSGFLNRRRRSKGGLDPGPITPFALRTAAVAAAILGATAVFTNYKGMPLAVLILVGFVMIFGYITTRTRFGRHIYAVGGNAEAARRAGIRVNGVRIAVFALASTMAAIGGIMAASRGLSVSQSSGASDLLLLAIAGPVIAGTSLFGGRGSVWTALTGALIIGSISNGMDLLSLESSVKFMVTGGVLLVAVIIDALVRKQRQAAGRM